MLATEVNQMLYGFYHEKPTLHVLRTPPSPPIPNPKPPPIPNPNFFTPIALKFVPDGLIEYDSKLVQVHFLFSILKHIHFFTPIALKFVPDGLINYDSKLVHVQFLLIFLNIFTFSPQLPWSLFLVV